jgi:hypothetical protein
MDDESTESRVRRAIETLDQARASLAHVDQEMKRGDGALILDSASTILVHLMCGAVNGPLSDMLLAVESWGRHLVEEVRATDGCKVVDDDNGQRYAEVAPHFHLRKTFEHWLDAEGRQFGIPVQEIMLIVALASAEAERQEAERHANR